MTNLASEFPDLYQSAISLYRYTQPWVIILMVVAFTIRVGNSMFGDPSQIMKAVLGLGIAGLMTEIFPTLANDVQLLAHAIVDRIGASPQTVHEEFAELLLSTDHSTGEPLGFWDVLRGLDSGLGEAIAYAFVYVCGQCAWAISYLFHWVQQVLIIYGIAIAPIFIAFCLFDSLRAVGGKYFLGMASLAHWPLGWAIADVLSTSLMGLSVGPSGELSSDAFWAILLLGLWMIFSTIAAPLVITKMLTSGVNAGSSLIKSFVSTITAGATHAMGAGVTASMFGAGKGWVASAAGLAGTTGFVGSALGSSSSLPTAVIGVSAGALGSRSAPMSGNYSAEAESIYKKSQ